MQEIQPIAKYILFPNLNGRDLLQLCQTNKAFRELCNDDTIWEQKVREDYFIYMQDKPENITWRQFYVMLIHAYLITVSIDGYIMEIPNVLGSRNLLSNLIGDDPWYICFVFRFPIIIDVFTPDYTNNFNLDQATDVIFLTRASSEEIWITGEEYMKVDAITINRSLPCENFTEEQLIKKLVKKGFLIDFYSDVPPDVGWKYLLEDFKLDTGDLCKLMGALFDLNLAKW